MDGYTIVNVLGCFLILTSLFVVLTKTPKKAAYVYGVQSLVLISIFIALGAVTGSTQLYTWSFTAFLTKVIFVPGVMLFALKKMGNPDEQLDYVVKPAISVILVMLEVAVCFAVVQQIELPTSDLVKPALAVSLAHFFVGLTCIMGQRSIFKQAFGYCLMENGSHLTLALLAPTAPEIVEIGIATDAIFAVTIMAIIMVRVYKKVGTLDSNELMELKG